MLRKAVRLAEDSPPRTTRSHSLECVTVTVNCSKGSVDGDGWKGLEKGVILRHVHSDHTGGLVVLTEGQTFATVNAEEGATPRLGSEGEVWRRRRTPATRADNLQGKGRAERRRGTTTRGFPPGSPESRCLF